MNYDLTADSISKSLGITEQRELEICDIIIESINTMPQPFGVAEINHKVTKSLNTMEEAFFAGQAIPIYLQAECIEVTQSFKNKN